MALHIGQMVLKFHCITIEEKQKRIPAECAFSFCRKKAYTTSAETMA
jgi:hypothetical protein